MANTPFLALESGKLCSRHGKIRPHAINSTSAQRLTGTSIAGSNPAFITNHVMKAEQRGTQ
ncbi:hypothetical protein DPMN_063934 [Dreissena polymorpha]|uniref:Uncharacterized protein n=1 Tax=Dreissena polymorpha TaxID=45954 RepID=A0A9D4CCF1_DREPO|nr:hypothetical protein DPMN_063934 [Dreissena polymorpha]